MLKNNLSIEVDKNKPHILWMSNSPCANTGYGSVSRNVLFPLAKLGYEIDALAYYGQESHVLSIDGVNIFPKLYHTIGRDAMDLLLKYRKPDIFITLTDVWVTVEPNGRSWVADAHPYSTCYAPVDHDPIPKMVHLGLQHCYQPIAMSKYGFNAMINSPHDLKKLNPILINHGVNTEIFKPMDRVECRKSLELPQEPFIVGIVAMNKGPRKSFPEMFHGFAQAAKQIGGPEKIKLYINTDLRQPDGMDLTEMIAQAGLTSYTVTTHPFARYAGINDEQQARIYNSCNLNLLTSRGEGFGLPILESAACGIPSITQRFTTMTELVEGHGWLVDTAAFDMSGLLSWQAIPKVSEIRDAIIEAYTDDKKLRQFGADSLRFAQDYDYKTKILPLWVNYLDLTMEIIQGGKKQVGGAA